MLKVGDQVLGGNAVVVSVSNDYRVFQLRSLYLGDPTTGVPFTVTFDAGAQVEDIKRALGVA